MTTSERPMKFKDFLGGALYGWCGEYRRGWNDALDAEREWSSQTSPPTPHGEAVLKAAHAIRLAQGAALAIGASEEMQAAFLQRCADVISKYGDTLLTLIEGCEVQSPYAPPAEAREPVGGGYVMVQRTDAEHLARFGFNNAGDGHRAAVKFAAMRVQALLAQPRDTPRDSGDAISERENGLLSDMEMFAKGRDLVTGDPITLADVQRIASRWTAMQSPTGEPSDG